MPKVSNSVINSVFFLYPDIVSAKAGINAGGTGFVVSRYFKVDGRAFQELYGVTAWHVAVRAGNSVVRLSTPLNGQTILDFAPEDWVFQANGPDVAVIPMGSREAANSPACIDCHSFVGEQHDITIGEEAFMLGLFIDHAGKSTNNPAARFGNISMLASAEATLEQPTKYFGQSFVIDLHSRTGFSGSPVFTYRTPLSDLTHDSKLHARMEMNDLDRQLSSHSMLLPNRSLDLNMRVTGGHLRLLGLHWMQFPERWEIHEDIQGPRKPNPAFVQGMSGMTCVIPAWDIVRVLDQPKLRAAREKRARTP